ncbi:Anaphase-promoting complex subunit 5 [Homalodisca vitripennis]|nr:Anaphase-promoting complex subunit 5 [Homalodisca vitripennis]
MPEPSHRRNFSMLILHLIQCPDMDYKELIDMLEFGKYKLVPNLLRNFLTEMEGFTQKEVGSLMDTILNLGRLLIDPISLVNKSSPIGNLL